MTHKIFKYVLAFLGLAFIFPFASMGQQADLEEKELLDLIGEGLEAAVELGTLSEEDAKELFRELTTVKRKRSLMRSGRSSMS